MSERVVGIITILLVIVGIIGFFTGIGEIGGFAAGGLVVLFIAWKAQLRKNSAK